MTDADTPARKAAEEIYNWPRRQAAHHRRGEAGGIRRHHRAALRGAGAGVAGGGKMGDCKSFRMFGKTWGVLPISG